MRILRAARPSFLLALCIVVGLGGVGGPSAMAGDSLRIVVGRISAKPSSHFPRMRALADYLAGELAPDGVTGVDVVLVDSLDEMRELMATGRVDMMSETAFMAVSLVDSGVAELLLREWKQGVAEYHSIFFARADSGLGSLGDLAGHSIAFEDPGSTSAYLIPRVTLERAGLGLHPMDRADDHVASGDVGYVFADGEINIVAWVHRGLADAGAVSNLDWENGNETPSFLKDDLVIIHETPPIIRSMMLVRSDLDDALKSRISEILQGMHESEAGRRAMRRYFSVVRYDPIDAVALDGLEIVRDIGRRFEPAGAPE